MSLLANVARYMLTGVATTIVVGKCVTEPLAFKKEFDDIQKAREKMMGNNYSSSVQIEYKNELDSIDDEENIKDLIDNASDLVENYVDMKEKKKKMDEETEVNREKHDGISGPPNDEIETEDIKKIDKMIKENEEQGRKQQEEEEKKAEEQSMDDLVKKEPKTGGGNDNTKEASINDLVEEDESNDTKVNNEPKEKKKEEDNEEDNNIKH